MKKLLLFPILCLLLLAGFGWKDYSNSTTDAQPANATTEEVEEARLPPEPEAPLERGAEPAPAPPPMYDQGPPSSAPGIPPFDAPGAEKVRR